jgi:hypothetical protein
MLSCVPGDANLIAEAFGHQKSGVAVARDAVHIPRDLSSGIG